MEFQEISATTAVSRNTAAGTNDTPKICFSSSLYQRNMTPDKRTSVTVCCRICHEDENKEELIDPCECSGTLGLIHTSCLEKWLTTSNTDRCEICKHRFVIQKMKKPLSQSFCQWWTANSIHGAQGIASDIICLMVLTPLCIAATYFCGVGAFGYIRLGFWEGTGLVILCCMLVAAYCLWLIVTIRFHLKSWQEWCIRNQDVKLMVKHKSMGSSRSEPQVKIFWHTGQDSNNNNAGHGNRFITWLFSYFKNDDEYLYPLQQTTIFDFILYCVNIINNALIPTNTYLQTTNIYSKKFSKFQCSFKIMKHFVFNYKRNINTTDLEAKCKFFFIFIIGTNQINKFMFAYNKIDRIVNIWFDVKYLTKFEPFEIFTAALIHITSLPI
ncbi:uncharacterized protein LOC143185153 [Calliopsis andreniformis]|uniref:uncharacterized protein LOC143185153 n=1 Tax=Calliopsis andreniformis TaxID=337506 RepID=UPI003FCC6E65